LVCLIIDRKAKTMVCHDWKVGKCSHGQNCKFSHDKGSGSGRKHDRKPRHDGHDDHMHKDRRDNYHRDEDHHKDYRREDDRRDDYRRDDYRRDDRRASDRRKYKERSRSRGRGSRDSRRSRGRIEKGRILSINEKCFGFIEFKGTTIYFHASGVSSRETFDDLRRGDNVEFEVGRDKRSGRDLAVDVIMVRSSRR